MGMLPEEQVIGVSVLNRLARELLETHLPGLWVSGEVSNLTRAASGHCYFTLKDGAAQVRCALFKGRSDVKRLVLQEGDQIELTGRITLYEARGEFQIVVEQIRQTGAGRLYAAYAALKEKLQAEGLFAKEKKQELPYFPKSIGIVTSPSAAALRDVVKTLQRRMSNIKLIIYPTAVQGKGSELSIAHAINTANQRAEVDVLIVCRGGGSIEDLWSFNEEVVVRAIAACNLPVVSGVGHETDFTLSDLVADVRASTPTAAAEIVAPDKMQLQQHCHKIAEHIQQQMQRRLIDAVQHLDYLNGLLRHPKDYLVQKSRQIFILREQMKQCMERKYEQKNHQLIQYKTLLWQYCPNIVLFRQRLSQQEVQLTQHRNYLMREKQLNLDKLYALLSATSPQNILQRGFSVVRDTKKQIIRSPDSLRLGQKIHIDFANGGIWAVVSEEGKQQDLFD